MIFNSTKVNIKVLNIEDEGSHLFVESTINNRPALLLMDSGASRSVFDLSRIRLFETEKIFTVHEKLSTGLGTNSMPTQGVILGNFTIGKLSLNNFDAILLNLQHVNESYSSLGLPPIDGVLGNDILVRYKAIIDLQKNKLTLSLTTYLL